MISKTYIAANLRSLNYKFDKTKSSKDALLYSKLAILELCGWIEMSMDDLILRCAKDNLVSEENRHFINKKIVEKNYGFEYKSNFRSMVCAVLGLSVFEKIERLSDDLKIARFRSTLGSLKIVRNDQAHTYIKSITVTIDAPSVTLRNFNYIYDGFMELERVLRELNYLKTKFLRNLN